MGDYQYLAVGPNVWWTEETASKALAEIRRTHGPGLREYTIYRFPAGTNPWVDQMGTICWTVKCQCVHAQDEHGGPDNVGSCSECKCTKFRPGNPRHISGRMIVERVLTKKVRDSLT